MKILFLLTVASLWISSAMNHLKEWAGSGALAGLLVLVSLVGMWCLCKMRFAQRRKTAMIVQAFTAIETGQSPPGMVDGHAKMSDMPRM